LDRRIGNMADAECPECAGIIALAANVEVGEIVSCPDCGCKLEVTVVNPPAVQKAPEVQEDWGE
jgi:alpha-aminoadipate carrier protein LysW